jgi:NitT/TauT family transport system substrate-binding protein
MTSKAWIKSAVIAVVMAAMSAQSALAADPVRIMLDWIPGGWHSALYLGRDKGCFSDQNLEISIARGAGGVDAVAKVASDVADVGAADLGTVMVGINRNNAPIKAILPLYGDSPFGVLAPASAHVDGLSDLQGLTLAAAPGDSNIQMLPQAMAMAGADFSKVKVVRADPSALVGLLLQGQVDAMTTFLTTAEIPKAIGAKAGRKLEFYHYGKKLGVYGVSYFASEKFLQSRPDVVRRLVVGLECAYRAANNNPAAAVDALLREFPEKNRDAELAAATAGARLTFGSDTFGTHGFDWDDARAVRTLELTLAAQGVTKPIGDIGRYLQASH